MSDLSYRMLFIGSAPAGLLGLEELFAELYAEGLTPQSAELDERLVKGVKKNNFVPKPAIPAYLAALKTEYLKYFSAKKAGRAVVAREYGTWQGHKRESIPWFPTVSSELCNGCGKCFDMCAHEVYARGEDGKVIVVEPFLCIVGCCFCKSVCEPHALLFPTQDLLNSYRPKA